MGFLSDLFGGLTQGAPQMMAGYTGGLVKGQQANLQQEKLEEDRALRRELAKMQQADKDARVKTEDKERKARILTSSLDRLDRDLRNIDRLSEYDKQRLLPNMKKQRATFRLQLKDLGYDFSPMFEDEDDFLPAPPPPAPGFADVVKGLPAASTPVTERVIPPSFADAVKALPGPSTPAEAPFSIENAPPKREPGRQFFPSEKTAQGIDESKAREGFYGAREAEIKTLTPARLADLMASKDLKLSKIETEDLMRDPRYEKTVAEIDKLDGEIYNLKLKPGFDERRVKALEKQAGVAAGRLTEQVRHNKHTESIATLRADIYKQSTGTDRAYKRTLMRKIDAETNQIANGLSPTQKLQYQTAVRLLSADILGLGVNTLSDTEKTKLRKTVDSVHSNKGLPSLFDPVEGDNPITPNAPSDAVGLDDLNSVDELFRAGQVAATVRYWDKADPARAKRLRRAILQRKGKTFDQLFAPKTKKK